MKQQQPRQRAQSIANIAAEIGDFVEVTLVPSRRGGWQTGERINEKRAFVINARKLSPEPTQLFKARLASQNDEKTVYFIKILYEISNQKEKERETLRELARSAGEHFRNGQFAEAAPLYNQVLSQCPEETFVAVQLAKCYAEMGKHEDAYWLYNQLATQYLEVMVELSGVPENDIELDRSHQGQDHR